MAYLTAYQYYENSGNVPEDLNWGSYQYVSLKDIVNNFLLMHTGNHSLINNEPRYKVLFHAKRGIQELNYDAMKNIKILELDTCDTLRFILPQDYVNWIRISYYVDGVLLPLSENIQTLTSKAYLQDNDCKILFDQNGNALEPQHSTIDMDRITGTKKSIYLNQNSPFHGKHGYCCDGEWYFDYNIGARYGLNTETANANPTFGIDRTAGVINFDSTLAGGLVIVEYVSDGMEGGDESLIGVNKLFEKYLYSYIKAELLTNKLGVQEYVVRRAKKEAMAELRNAKIRISNIHPGRLLMNMRGQNKWIK